jgi:penicillin-binding protein 2
MKPFRRSKLHFDLRIGLTTSLAPSSAASGEPNATSLRAPLPLRIAVCVAVVAFLGLAGRLVQLQALLGDDYLQRSTNNFIRERELEAVRGQIRDRRGEVLADNRPTFHVYATPRYVSQVTLGRLARLLKMSEEQREALTKKLGSKRGGEASKQVLVAEDISRDQLAALESEKDLLPGIDIESRTRRVYPQKATAAHLLGYLNMAGPDDLKRGYKHGDYVGRSGLEQKLEQKLRGSPGFERIFVDAHGRRKSEHELGKMAQLAPQEMRRDPQPGLTAVLTIDLELQHIVEEALSRHASAAAAVVEADTGRVLAMASYPSPDPNLLGGRLTRGEAQRLESDPFRPLLDKSLRETYYPGSTFKIIPALAALEEGLIDPDQKQVCYGRYELGRHVFRCMKAHGPVPLHEALSQSCNVYFYHLAEKVGLERMARWAERFGFGQPMGLGLGEASGFVPTLDYYKQHGGFRGGYALNTALGQGAVRASVLQLAMAYAALGNGGKLYQPMLVERLETPSGDSVEQFAPQLRAQLPILPSSLERLRRALVDVVADHKGTASTAFIEGLDVAGKSGTAQVRKNRRGESSGWDQLNDHAWFVGYSPSRNAKIAVAVLIEHGGLGGHVAAPTATRIIQGYFDRIDPEHKPRPIAEGPAIKLRTTLPASAGAR